MSKGDQTRAAILDRAVSITSRIGLEALTIGTLADEVGMSKSGLFAHFDSKENLQLQVVKAAIDRFVAAVVGPAFKSPRGIPRIEAIFDRWIAWEQSDAMPGGCVFIAAASEFDDRPGQVREALAVNLRDWMGALATAAQIAVDEGHFRRDVEVEQFAYDFNSIILGYHHFNRMMRDPKALDRARRSFERLIDSAKI